MNKIIRFIHAYLILGFPFIIIGIIWKQTPQLNIFLKVIYELISWNFMVWFLTLILFLIMLIVMPKIREKTIQRLANIRERDEREEYITGKASRATYISSLSLLIFLFFFSIFSVSIYSVPESKAINGKHRFASIGLGFSILEKPKVKSTQERTIIFVSDKISFSKSSIILLLLCWQLIVFNFIARKEQMKTLR